MFCTKCGNSLPDDAKFCGVCGAPVKILQEASPVTPQSAGIPDETVSIQVPQPEPVLEAKHSRRELSRDAKASGKKSKKSLAIGLSIGGVLIAAFAVVLIFGFNLKGNSKGSKGSVPIPILDSAVVYDDQYTYYISETENWEPCIKRVQNDLQGQAKILYESEKIKGDGWSVYTLGGLFLWNDKICFIEITKATEQDREYEIHWLSKDGGENGTLVSHEQLCTYGNLLSQMGGIYFFDDYLILGNSQYFYRLDFKTGELCKHEDLIDLEGPVCFVAYNNGYYYYLVPDIENNLMGETLYRKSEKSKEEIVGKVPSQDDDDVEKYFSFISKGNYLYYADLDNIYRLNIEDGSTENLASYEETYNRFAMCENGFYYFKDASLHFLNTETLEETIFGKVEDVPNLIYAGADDACWMQDDSTSHRYTCFLPDEQDGAIFYFGESEQDTLAENQETVNTTELYADVVENAIAEFGSLWFKGNQFDCIARGVIKIDLLDFNQDGTDELMMIYSNDSVVPFIDIWTVKDGETVQVFSGQSRVNAEEPIFSVNLYQNADNLYVPVYDSLDCNPVYVHLYGFDNEGEFGEIYQYEDKDFCMNNYIVQVPDGMEFMEYENVIFYVDNLWDDFEGDKNTMKETLQTEMEDALNILGITLPENSSTAYDYEGDWVWNRENSDMVASLQLKATDASTLSGELSFYRLFGEQLTIAMSGNTGTVTSEFGNFEGTARFESGCLYLCFEDQVVYSDYTISKMFGTTEFCFTSVNPTTQAGDSEFDITSMLGEWTLAESQPNVEYVPRYLIRLNADGTMNLRGEDGTWADYTYTIDATHFYYTLPATDITSGGTYIVSGDTLIVFLED